MVLGTVESSHLDLQEGGKESNVGMLKGLWQS